jgi:hypothetical protein
MSRVLLALGAIAVLAVHALLVYRLSFSARIGTEAGLGVIAIIVVKYLLLRRVRIHARRSSVETDVHRLGKS